jgi:methyl-accepting chemotaxis protein
VASRLTVSNTSVGRFTDIVNEITDSAKQQSVGIKQVSSAMAEMDMVTQQNAASAEASSAAAARLASHSESLAQLVASWQIDHMSTGPSPGGYPSAFRALSDVGSTQ